jgi:hypothetical protein
MLSLLSPIFHYISLSRSVTTLVINIPLHYIINICYHSCHQYSITFHYQDLLSLLSPIFHYITLSRSVITRVTNIPLHFIIRICYHSSPIFHYISLSKSVITLVTNEYSITLFCPMKSRSLST